MEEINITGIHSHKLDELNETKTSKKKRGLLHDKKIAISVSENEDLYKLGFTIQHLNDISIEIARYIIANDGVALYGGDLRQNGFTGLFSELSKQYVRLNEERLSFVNYFVFPNTKSLNKEVRIHFMANQIGIQEIDLPKSLNISYVKKYNILSDLEDRYTYSECFKQMRTQMAKDSVARILVGGKSTNYLGYIPGVIEEALLTLRENKPVYLVGGLGGATLQLINLIKGKEVKELTNETQYKSDFLKSFQEFVKNKCEYSDFENLKLEFQKYDLNKLSELNKLSVEENEILFFSKNIHEIVYLLMKGLKSIEN